MIPLLAQNKLFSLRVRGVKEFMRSLISDAHVICLCEIMFAFFGKNGEKESEKEQKGSAKLLHISAKIQLFVPVRFHRFTAAL